MVGMRGFDSLFRRSWPFIDTKSCSENGTHRLAVGSVFGPHMSFWGTSNINSCSLELSFILSSIKHKWKLAPHVLRNSQIHHSDYGYHAVVCSGLRRPYSSIHHFLFI